MRCRQLDCGIRIKYIADSTSDHSLVFFIANYKNDNYYTAIHCEDRNMFNGVCLRRDKSASLRGCFTRRQKKTKKASQYLVKINYRCKVAIPNPKACVHSSGVSVIFFQRGPNIDLFVGFIIKS